MSEQDNLDWVCGLADGAACRYWSPEDLNDARSRIAALRAEFAELRRKADAFDDLREWVDLSVAKQKNAWGNKVRRYAFEEVLRKIDSMTKGENDDQG